MRARCCDEIARVIFERFICGFGSGFRRLEAAFSALWVCPDLMFCNLSLRAAASVRQPYLKIAAASVRWALLPDTEAGEDHAQQILRIHLSGDFSEGVQGFSQVDGCEFGVCCVVC